MFGHEKERCEILAEFLIKNQTTVRVAAQRYGISKSTVHKDVTAKLREVNRFLYEEVKSVLNVNKSERHIRGGEATRQKYLQSKTNESRAKPNE